MLASALVPIGKNQVRRAAALEGETEEDDVHKNTDIDVKSKAEAVKAKAAEVAEKMPDQVKDAVKAKAAEVADKMPDQVKDAADKVTTEAKKRPVLVMVAAGVILALVARRLMRRGKTK
ncbi:hypothetical protein ACIBHX_05430 [Nonomuraea sp. NPDC050536]|uniref:hypothetical protein n=1 Tax=Nonomuraea sp. NPDC050536 TaxID=3364366 RepID=UPI0037C6B6A2